MNKILATGRTTANLELKQTASGISVVEFSLAVKRAFKNANGEYDSDFFNCVAYSKTAETISRYVKKGDQVGIEGRLQTRNYTNSEGRKIYVTEIIVENFEFLQAKKQEDNTAPKFDNVDPFSNAKYEEIDAESDLPF